MNTIEHKAKFFSQYYGQNIFTNPMWLRPHTSKIYLEGENFEQGHLLLTPLSAISDEDAIEVVKIANSWDEESHLLVEDVEEWIDEIMTGNCATSADYVSGRELLELTDYLRSKSYALPYMGLSVEELVSRGWITLKD